MSNSSGHDRIAKSMDEKVVTWCVTYGIVALAVIVTNGTTIEAFRQSRLLRKFGHCFLVNLAVADFMVGMVALPMYIYLISSSSYSPISAKLTAPQALHIAVDQFSGMASVFTLTVISLERVYAIYCPLRYRTVSQATYYVVLCDVWILAAALTGTWVLTFLEIIHDDIFAFSLALLSFASLLIMSLSYACLWLRIKLWSRNQQRIPGEKERSLAKAIGLVIIIFLLTWSPFHIMNILINFKASLFDEFPYQVIYVAKFLHYSNSFMNPFIYCFKIPEFRRAVKNLLSFWRKKKRQETRL